MIQPLNNFLFRSFQNFLGLGIFALIILFISPLSAHATARTSAQAGNWSSPSTWTGGVVPGNGDTVTINHAVVVDTATTVGASGNPVYGYVSSITGSGGTGYSSCTASIGSGTPLHAAVASCSVSGGVATVSLGDRGWYSAGTPALTFTPVGGSGASWTLNYQAGGGTPAILVGVNGKITINANLTVRGDFIYGAEYGNTSDAIIFGPGTTTTMDSSLASGTPIYHIGPNADVAYRAIRTNCISSRCTLTATGNISTIDGLSISSFRFGPQIDFNNILISHFGDAITKAMLIDNENVSSYKVLNSKFDTDGEVLVYTGDETYTVMRHEYNEHVNTVGNLSADFYPLTKTPTIPETIIGNVFDKSVGSGSPGGSMPLFGTTITGNYFGEILSSATLGNPVNAWAAFSNNFIRIGPVGAPCSGGSCFQVNGNMSDSYFFVDYDEINPHITTGPGFTTTYSNLIFGMSLQNNGDSGESINGNGGNITVQNSINLPDAYGQSMSEFEARVTSGSNTSTFYHNTWFGGQTASSPNFSMIDLNETNNNAAGVLTLKDNIMFNPTFADSFMKIVSVNLTTPTQDVCSPGNCDYNTGYNHALTEGGCSGCTNSGRGYGGKWSATPGAHDIDTNPNFLDYQRTVELFDIGYLGKPAGTQWSIGGTYVQGDIVSNADSTVYWNKTINYRCIAVAGCTGAPKPGYGLSTGWRSYWEWASLYWIRQGVVAQTVYTDSTIGCGSGCNIMQAVNQWIRKGYSPTNVLLRNAGHDGVTIGAVEYTAALTVPDAPTIGTAVRTGVSGQVNVPFTAPASDGGSTITSYTATSSPGGITGTLSQAGSGTIVVNGLTNGTAYTFTVTATNTTGTSSASSASNSATPATVPSTPSAPSATAGNAQATVTFTAPAANGSAITGYTVTSIPSGGTDSNAGSTGLSHVVTGLTNLTSYTFTVHATNAVGNSAESSASSPGVTPTAGVPTATSLSITGTKTVGQTLTGNYTFTDPNSQVESGTTYQWMRASSSGGSYSNIGSATNQTYVLTSTDIGQYIEFKVTPASASGTGSPTTSSPTTQISSSAAPTASSVTISGTETEGQTLTGHYTYAQTDSVAEGTSTFRWLSAASSVGSYSAIGGATSNTYALAPSDVGRFIKFEVTPVAVYPVTTGSAATSSPTGAIIASSLPVASSLSVTGTLTSGQTLTGHYTYSDTGSHPEGTSTFRWLSATTSGGSYSAIGGATSSTYVLASTEVGKYVRFEVTPISTVATGSAVQSNPTTQIQNTGVPTASAVSISGTADVGATLTGNYTYADPGSFAEGTSTFRWLESDTLGGSYSAIGGATSSTYLLEIADIGKFIKFEVTPVATVPPTNGSPVLSAATSQVSSSAAPTASSVTISGTETEGQTLTGHYTYAQTDSVAEGTSTFRWLTSTSSGGSYSAIGGATSSTYVLVTGDVGKYIKFEVTPVAIFAPTDGDPVLSSATGAIQSITSGSTIPDAPNIGTATKGSHEATVTFTAPVDDGGSAITGYTVTSIPDGGVDSNADSTSLSHLVTGLENGIHYTFTVHATNINGDSAESSESNSIVPASVGSSSGGSSGGSSGTVTPPPPSSTPSSTPATNPSSPSGPITTYNFGITTLKNGSSGDAVKELQKFLNDTLQLGLIVDGKLGPLTIEVIKKWQLAHGLVPDGLVGPQTKAAMNNTTPSNTPTTTHTGTYNFGSVTLQIHSRGEAVKELQTFLNVSLNLHMTVDGVFGQETLLAVQNWQRIHGLTVDGGVGPQTKGAMLASLSN